MNSVKSQSNAKKSPEGTVTNLPVANTFYKRRSLKNWHGTSQPLPPARPADFPLSNEQAHEEMKDMHLLLQNLYYKYTFTWIWPG